MALPFNLESIAGYDLVGWLNRLSPEGMRNLKLSQSEVDSLIQKVMQTSGPGDVSRLSSKFGVDANRISQATGIPAGTLQDVNRQIINDPTQFRTGPQEGFVQYTPETAAFDRPATAPPVGMYRSAQGYDQFDPRKTGTIIDAAGNIRNVTSGELLAAGAPDTSKIGQARKARNASILQPSTPAPQGVTTPTGTAAPAPTGAAGGIPVTPPGTGARSPYTASLPTLDLGADLYRQFSGATGNQYPRLQSQLGNLNVDYSDIENRLKDIYGSVSPADYSDIEQRLQDIYSGLSNIDITQDPSYRFRFEEGQRALERSAAARGGLFSGRTGRELTRYGQDLASTEYQNAYQRAAQTAQLQAGGALEEAGLRGRGFGESVQAAGLQGSGAVQEAALRQQQFGQQLQQIAAQQGLSTDEFNRLLASYGLSEQAFGAEFGRGFNLAGLGLQAALGQLGGANVPTPGVSVAQGQAAPPGVPGSTGAGSGLAQTGFGLQSAAAQQIAQAGQLQAAGGLASGQQASSNIGSLLQAAALAYGASDVRLKKNIKYIGKHNNHKWYSFDYIWDKDGTNRFGVMAQEVMKSDPESVIMHPSGYYMVNYLRVL